MHTNIHKKSLLYTLRESKGKTKKHIKLLVLITLSIAIFLLVFAVLNISQWYSGVIIALSIYVLHLCKTIFYQWKTQKKIKRKLKTLQTQTP